jgi:hypothetical protein
MVCSNEFAPIRPLNIPTASESLLPKPSYCKACAVWAPLVQLSNGDESNFVFAGGTSDFVGLYDLRMDGSRLECLQSTKPLCFDSSLALPLVV